MTASSPAPENVLLERRSTKPRTPTAASRTREQNRGPEIHWGSPCSSRKRGKLAVVKGTLGSQKTRRIFTLTTTSSTPAWSARPAVGEPP
ncbi:hypothetical protein HPB50_019082 [Hyalomma asiaticum]|uniref:Uncharacterized protein n=1 Tax=Hyalomma asiaticum TaxID=266040 RepID=A0ACB7RM85_HYAAI|nr:hypothetical protein HPB50_019082 [Hyalomma asiaticum]